MTLPLDIARCPGEGSWEDDEWNWREGCDDCQRRTSPGGRVMIQPPTFLVFEYEYRISPEDRQPATAP